jgi:hypothetical protein
MAVAHVPAHSVPTDAEWPAVTALELAFKQADAAGVVALMCAHAQSACIQAVACSALIELLKRNQETLAAVVAAGALTPLLAALHAHSGVAELLELGVHLLSRLLGHSSQRDADTDMAVSLGAVEIVVDALREHTCDPALAQNATVALGLLVWGDHPERGVAAVAAGAAEAVVRAQHTHLANSHLQRNCIQVLYYVLLHCCAASAAAAVERICAGGAADASLAALRQHTEDAEVQEAGWHLLHELCQHDQAHCAAGVFAAAAATLRVPAAPMRMCVHERVCGTVVGFTHEHAGNQRLALDAGVIDALITLLRRTTSTTPLHLVGVAFIALGDSMTHCADAVLHAGRMGAVEAVVKAMRAHSSAHSVVHASGCHTLFRLVQGNEGHVAAALRAGAIAVVQAAEHACGDDAEHERDLEYIRCLLRILQEGDASAAAAADAAMAALLAEEEAERSARPAAPLKAKSKSGKKKKRGGSGNGGTQHGAAASGAAADVAPDDTHEPNAPAAETAATTLGAGADAQEDNSDAMMTAIAATAALAPDHGGADAATDTPPPSSDEAAGGAHAAAPVQHDADAVESALRSPSSSAQQSEQPPTPAPPALPAPAPLPAPRTMAPRRYEPPVGGASPTTCAAEAAAADAPMQQQQQRQATVSLGAASGAAQLPSYLAHLVLSAPPAQAPPQPALADAPPQLPPPAPPAPPAPALKECCVCLDDVAQADLLLLMPCAHRCVCQACADALMAILPPAPRRCPKCREPVWRASRVFED